MNMNTMVLASVLAGFLSTMNIWVVRFDDVRLHLNDVYMVALMTGWMMFFSYLYGDHNDHTQYNIKYMIASLVVVVIAIYGIRTQMFVTDSQFLNGMIPHHSMAIQMAQHIREKTQNKKIHKLATDIIKSQTREIDLMNDILNDL